MHKICFLYQVARAWHVDVAQFLIDQKANINVADNYGRTPLHVAAAVDYPEMVNFLIKMGGRCTLSFAETIRINRRRRYTLVRKCLQLL